MQYRYELQSSISDACLRLQFGAESKRKRVSHGAARQNGIPYWTCNAFVSSCRRPFCARSRSRRRSSDECQNGWTIVILSGQPKPLSCVSSKMPTFKASKSSSGVTRPYLPKNGRGRSAPLRISKSLNNLAEQFSGWSEMVIYAQSTPAFLLHPVRMWPIPTPNSKKHWAGVRPCFPLLGLAADSPGFGDSLLPLEQRVECVALDSSDVPRGSWVGGSNREAGSGSTTASRTSEGLWQNCAHLHEIGPPLQIFAFKHISGSH